MRRRPLRRLGVWLGLIEDPAPGDDLDVPAWDWHYRAEYLDVDPVADPAAVKAIETYANHPVHRRRTD